MNTIKPQELSVKDLRVGNNIRINGIIVTIDERTIFDFNHDGRKKEPIKLTEEILLRCGFEMDSYNRLINNSPVNFMRHPNDKGGLVCFAHNCSHGHIKYLHQLQNLFYSLTGEELTLKDHA